MKIEVRSKSLQRISYFLLGFFAIFLGISLSGGLWLVTSSNAQTSEISGSQQGGNTTKNQSVDEIPNLPLPASGESKPGVPSNTSAEVNANGKNSQGEPTKDSVKPATTENLEIESEPVFDPNVDFRYEPTDKRDPFRPFRDSKLGVGQLRSPNRKLDPLEKFEVKNLEVVAIVWGNEKPRALIQDPERQVHSVIKGQRIGKNEGFVAEIREGEIVVVELFDLNGKIVKESIILQMKK